jgi:colicin import membrane protein
MSMQSYRLGFILSCAFHILLLLILSINFVTSGKVYVTQKNKKKEIVNAVSIDQSQVLAEVERIKQQKQAKELAEQKRKKRLEQQARDARKKRLAEQRRLNRIKKQAQEIERKRKRQQALERKRLAELKRKKQQQRRELEQLQKQKLKEQQRLDEIQKKQQEQARQQKMEQELARKKAKKLADEAAARAKRQQLMGEVNKYKALIINAISQNWILPDNVDKTLSSKFEIKLAPGGAVLSVKLLRSSGDSVLDRSAQTAIYRASPLPVPEDPEAFKLFRVVSLTVKPETIVDNT